MNWLRQHGQTPRTVERFWGLVLTSALNETPDRIGLRYARKVFVDGFLRHRRGFEVELPIVPLGRFICSEELLSWLDKHGVELLLNQGAKRFLVSHGEVTGVELREWQDHGGRLVRQRVFPFDRLLDLLPVEIVEKGIVFPRPAASS